MTRRVCVMAAGLFAALGAPQLLAAPAIGDCRVLADPAARLACYDALAGQAAAPAVAPPASATAPFSAPIPQSPSAASRNDYVQAAPPRVQAVPNLNRRSDFESRIAAVIPQRHGYYRFVLEDGSTYFTTAVAPPVPVGAAVHIRRTIVGTTYLDTNGRDPIAIRLARQQ